MITRYACFGNAYDRWEVCALHRHESLFRSSQVSCDVLQSFTIETEQKSHKQLSCTAAYEQCREKAMKAVDKLNGKQETNAPTAA